MLPPNLVALNVQFHHRMNFPNSVVRHVFATVVLIFRGMAYIPERFVVWSMSSAAIGSSTPAAPAWKPIARSVAPKECVDTVRRRRNGHLLCQCAMLCGAIVLLRPKTTPQDSNADTKK